MGGDERFKKRRSVAEAIRDGKLPQSTLERLAIVHEVAKIIEYLHSVEVLVKRLSDKNILLASENGTLKPYLTDLESARLVSMMPFPSIRSCLNSD
jgi:serine/threonine protein kinase